MYHKRGAVCSTTVSFFFSSFFGGGKITVLSPKPYKIYIVKFENFRAVVAKVVHGGGWSKIKREKNRKKK